MRHALYMAEAGAPSSRRRAGPSRVDGLRLVGAMVALMWVLEVINSLDGQRLDSEGIVPRHVSGLVGVVCAPFLHASFGHLIANTVPFVVLGAMIALGGAGRVLAVTVVVGVVAGLGTWLSAPSGSVTLGASGLVFGYATYLVVRGLFSRRPLELLLGVLVGALFGVVLIVGLVPHAGISWQDHLFGGVGGVVAARLMTPKDRRGLFAGRRGAPGGAGARPI